MIALIACDSPQEPRPELVVEVVPRFIKAPGIEIVDGLTRAYCFADIVARAKGPGNSHVEWRGGEFRMSAGTNREVVQWTQDLTAEEIDYSFGGAPLKASRELESRWNFTGNVPFTLTVVYDYTVKPSGVMNQTEPATAHCGPAMPPGGIAPPRINGFELRTQRSTLSAGDRLTFTLEASSASDIWLTRIQITGAFELDSLFAEVPRSHVVRSGDIIIPPNATVGQRLTVRMSAYDAFMQETFSYTLTTVEISDTRVTIDSLAPVAAPTITNVGGRYGAGQIIRPRFEVSDNVGLAWIVYEFADAAKIWRDSVPVSGLHANMLELVVRDEWIGQPQLRIYGRDASGNIGAPAVSAPIDIHPVVQRPVKRVTLRDGLTDYAYDPASGRVYVASGRPTVRVVDANTGMLIDSIVTASPVGALDLTSDATQLVMVPTGQPQLLIHDLVSRQTAAIDLHMADNTPKSAGLIRVSGNGRAIITVLASAEDTPLTVLTHEVNLADGLTRPATGAAARDATRFVRNANGSVIVAYASPGCLQVWRRADAGFDRCTTLWNGLWGMNDDASRFVTSTHVTDGRLNPLVAHRFQDQGQMIATFSPDGRFVYVATPGGLYKLDALTSFTIELDSAFRLTSPIQLSPDGRTFFGLANNEFLIGGSR